MVSEWRDRFIQCIADTGCTEKIYVEFAEGKGVTKNFIVANQAYDKMRIKVDEEA